MLKVSAKADTCKFGSAEFADCSFLQAEILNYMALKAVMEYSDERIREKRI